MLRTSIALSSLIFLLPSLAFTAPASQPSQDAWPLYSQAIQRIAEGDKAKIYCPASSPLAYADSPPYPAEWTRLETASYAFNAPARALVREARSRTVANWPAVHLPNGKLDVSYLRGCRNLTNEVGDAALFQHLHGDDAEAMESLRDVMHLADLLDGPNSKTMIEPLVAVGVRMAVAYRLDVITSDVALTNDLADAKKLQISTVKALIRQLYDDRDPEPRYADLFRREAGVAEANTIDMDRFLTQIRRGQMEYNLAAMSLACHLFQFDQHRWPASVEELTAYLPEAPRDAWGPMGYVVVKRQPGNVDRPLVYSQCDSASGGLFYPTTEPQYSWFSGVGPGDRKQGGQFRDVTLWGPAHPNPAPTTQPLQ